MGKTEVEASSELGSGLASTAGVGAHLLVDGAEFFVFNWAQGRRLRGGRSRAFNGGRVPFVSEREKGVSLREEEW